nr:Chain B, BISUBSTRATE PEPTIDE INHIBITOR [synthetic construct]
PATGDFMNMSPVG